MGERVETHDFMSVDSFSQLPFIRPSPKPSSPPSNSSNGNNIRLFGFDLPPDNYAKELAPSSTDNNEDGKDAAAAGSGSGGDSGRKFECHYCCRNFPTSQALGGHQNAHKRERQHAKRVHLQSAMAAAHAHHGHHHHQQHQPITEGHVYNILNYHRLSSGGPAAARLGLEPPPHYPSWSSTNTSSGARFYGGLGSAAHPINGNPLPAGLWRVPGGAVGMMVHRDGRSVALPNLLAAGGMESRPRPMLMGGNSGSSSSSPSSAASHPHDGVSLDLHL